MTRAGSERGTGAEARDRAWREDMESRAAKVVERGNTTLYLTEDGGLIGMHIKELAPGQKVGVPLASKGG